MFYLITKLLHYLPSEFSHHLALKSLKLLHSLKLLGLLMPRNESTSNQLHDSKLDVKFKKSFRSRLGIAAGLDKNGDYIDCLAELGVGFIEVGTVTPRPQYGNPKPRIFRNKNEKSILNRLGFNNKGVEYLVKKLEERNSSIPIGVSIGKNSDTPNEEAFRDYLYCMQKVYQFSDYIAVNISSPNTSDLRELSEAEHLDELLKALKEEQNKLTLSYGYVPIFLKISPDENQNNLEKICKSILENNIDGIICTNTTNNHTNIHGPGGISGVPLRNKSTKILIEVKKILGDSRLIIASGGVMSSNDFQQKLDSGANLVQIYSGFIYEGPKLVRRILEFEAY